MMDAKALAKSKRAHSQHHSKKPHKPPSSTAVNEPSNSKKQTFKQIREKAHQAERISALPSNWNRYAEEFDSGSEDLSQAPGSIVPKSKGADFRHLVAEAQSQSQSHSNHYSNTLSSLDDIIPGDFNQFVGSMLAVRGEGILSWTGNDNFIVDDSTTATPEASFLSLNLHALAEQLEKVDLSERLFIEEDLLPPDLHSERSKVNNDRESQQMQAATDKKEAAKTTEEITQNDFPEVNFAAKVVEDMSFGTSSQAIDAILSNKGLGSMPEVHDDSISGQCGEFSESRAAVGLNSTSVSNKEMPTFEAAAAEAELDMLLNSFSETKVLGTSSSGSKKPSSDLYMEGSPSVPQYTTKGIDSVKAPPRSSNFDGLLDDLLQETSTTVNRGIDSSKTAAVNSAFDDILDDLLQETSTMVNPKGLSEQKFAKAASDNNVGSSSSQLVSESKVLNDFESWLDTI
ncbi:ECERIFERUM 16, r RST1 interacting protein [Hibiscus trionum]|uniref:ECERIFERUM 16, r RST1 interacting protein n=1 Tax=Hibiscus trionum TaxID=183268 RepID=A0A9W7M3P6_HIBTR|nr:ECERIFERUM 16, r RST1 interacting protein [Hibiscus trionum]